MDTLLTRIVSALADGADDEARFRAAVTQTAALIAGTGPCACAILAVADGDAGPPHMLARVGTMVDEPLAAEAVGRLRRGEPVVTDGGGVLLPLRAGGRCVGILRLQGEGCDPDGPVTALATRAAPALALAMRQFTVAAEFDTRTATLERRAQRFDALMAVVRGVAAAVEEGDVAKAVATGARQLTGADLGILFARDSAGRSRPLGADGWAPGDPVPAVTELVDATDPTPVWLGRELAVGVGTAAGPDVPPPSLLVVARRGGAPFGDDDIARLSELAQQAAVALDNARLVGRLRRERGERRALAAALVDAQEEERRRVAEDIHDGPVQELVGVSLLLDALSTDLRRAAPDLVPEADRAAASAREAVRGLRRAIFDLHPMSLEELGFAAATRTLVQRLEWRGVELDVDVAAADRLSPALRTVAFRTCQEAIANVLRHADPCTVRITAHQDGDAVVLEVVDDGRGFDHDATASGIGEGHLGLAALRERATLVGGDLQVMSAVGRGTRLILRLPLEDARP